MKETEMNIDYEKLRKRLILRDFLTGFVSKVTFAETVDCVNAYNATPEQLIAIARRRGINLEKYKID